MKFSQHNYQVRLFKILSNSNRLRVLELLLNSRKALTVTFIADQLKIEQGNLSAHLTRMRENGIVTAKQDGSNMYYSVKDPNVARVLRAATPLTSARTS